MPSRSHYRAYLCVFSLLCVAAGFSQQFRGTLTGTVSDNQGAVIPGVRITVNSLETGARSQTVSTGTGNFVVANLAPGFYRVEAEAPNFKRFVLERVQIRSNEQTDVEITLDIGQVVETVTVTSEAPVLTTTTASTGQVIEERQIANMPMNGRTPLMLAQLAFGVIPTSDPRFTRPFDNAGPAGFSMGGAPGQTNELLLDGSPDTTRNRRVAYNPPVDTVQEVKVESFQADAAYGNTGGGTVNVVTRGGTNEFHGNAYNFNQVSRLAATDFFVNRTGGKKGQLVYNQWGVNAGGPIWLPKLIDGRNRVFWYFAYEGIKDSFPEPFLISVPTEAMRRGDFSQLLSVGANYQLYDPFSGVAEGNRVRRQPIPGNILPQSRLSPIARNTLNYFPLPNQPGEADGRNNYQVNTSRGDDFYSTMGRLDFNVSDKHKLFWNFRHNFRTEFRGFAFGRDNISNGNFLRRVNWGSTLDDVYTLTPTLIMNTRLNWTRFTEGSLRPSLGFDMTSLGFPGSLAAQSSQAVFPRFQFDDFRSLGDTGSLPFPFDNFQIFNTFTKISGGHTWKFGADLRLLREHVGSFGNASGWYRFRTNWTRGPLDSSPASPFAQDMAGFLLGLPVEGGFDVAAYSSPQAGYASFFVQDDWRVTQTLTLNLGLRYERELATTERYNRQLVGFDATTANRVTQAARAAYAQSPIPELPVSAFNPVGGPIYASSGNRSTTTTQNLFSPRFGFAWKPDVWGGKNVIRGGFGIFYFTEGLQPAIQPGFFQTTPFVATLDNFLTPRDTLDAPFRDGVLRPAGAADGINTFLGQAITFYNPRFRNPYSLRWNFSIQREILPNTVFEIGYMGNHAVRLSGARDLNFIPREFLSTSPDRDQPTIDRLTANVRNPFQGLLPGTGLNGSAIRVEQLLRPFPHFNDNAGVRQNTDNFGSSYFHMMQMRLERRFAQGFSFMGNYMWSKLIEKRSFLNNQDFAPEKRVASEDRPHRVVINGIWELPFGRGRAYGSNVNRAANLLIGGWTLSGIYTFNSGEPMTWGNVIYFGGDLNWNARNVDQVFDITRFNRNNQQQLDRNIRTFPSRFSQYRNDISNNWDVSVIKDFLITERVRLQYRSEFFNMMNRPAFGNPQLAPTNTAFGRITTQRNLPRTIQMALKLIW